MRGVIVLSVILLLLSGCSQKIKKVQTRNEGDIYRVTCNGLARSWDDCLKYVNRTCKSGEYKIIDQNIERIPGRNLPMPQARMSGGIAVATVICFSENYLESVKNEYKRSQEAIDRQVQDFAQNHEFFETVRLDMADLVDMYAAMGKNISLQEAYDIAVMRNKDLQKIIIERQRQASNN